MATVTCIESTVLKKRLVGSGDLANSEKINRAKDSQFMATSVICDRNQHLKCKLASPLLAEDGKAKLSEVYVYAPHVKAEGGGVMERLQLSVKYASQLDNDPSFFGSGSRQCCTTSNSMLADFLLKGDLTKQAKVKSFAEPESIYMRLVTKYGDTIDHNAQTQALEDLGIQSYYSTRLSQADVIQSLQAGIPVVAGVAYKSSGHIVLIVGHDPIKKEWLLHDPYGSRHGSADVYDVGVGGAYDPYSYDVMQRVFWDMGGEAGQGRIVTAVKGVKTGLS